MSLTVTLNGKPVKEDAVAFDPEKFQGVVDELSKKFGAARCVCVLEFPNGKSYTASNTDGLATVAALQDAAQYVFSSIPAVNHG